MFEFLSYGIGSVLGGLFTALIISGVLLAYSTSYTKRGAIDPIALIICGVLFCLLFYQTTMMYSAFDSKGVAMDFISALHLQFGNQINGDELREKMITLIQENPLISFFIDYGDLEDFDWSQPIKSLKSVVAREYNWYIFRRIIWSVVFSGLALVGILLTSNRKRSRRRRRYNDEDFFS